MPDIVLGMIERPRWRASKHLGTAPRSKCQLKGSDNCKKPMELTFARGLFILDRPCLVAADGNQAKLKRTRSRQVWSLLNVYIQLQLG